MTEATTTGWRPGQGWGWIWGDDDQVGALNAMSPDTVVAALHAVKRGVVYDLGAPLDRGSFLWPGHARTEVVTFRSPEGIERGKDLMPPGHDSSGVSFHTALVMLSDHAGAQLDGLCHATTGTDNHWYNGFTVQDWSGDFGPRKAGAENIPPIIARGVLADVAGHLGVAELEPSHPISADQLAQCLDAQGVSIRTGDVVLIRTGTMRHWGEAGHDHEAIAAPDSAGITLEAARWLVEDQGSMLVGGDTSTLEVVPPVDGDGPSPVHEYLLVDQGVHMGELHDLEGLAADGVYEFTYIALCPPVRGTTAGFALRPIAIT